MLRPPLLLSLSLAAAAQAPTTPASPTPLFDGKTLAGWTTTGGRYDGPAQWTVEDGCLVGRSASDGNGGLIYTDRCYHSFDLELDVRMDYPFDSGVFLRMRPASTGERGVQVTLDHRPGGEIGAVYSDEFLAHNEKGETHYRRGEWNHVRVRMVGHAFWLQAWVNGAQVTDYHLPADAKGFAESGCIGLQVHGGEVNQRTVRFKNITIRELPVFDPDQFELGDGSALRPKAGWKDLLGKDLSRWQPHGGDGSGFRLADGVLALLVDGQAHELRSKADFTDFDLRLDFKLATLANSGVFLRAKRDDSNPAYSGCEIQILDDHDWEAGTNSVLKAWQKTGSLYGSVAPKIEDALYPTGTWNTLEISYTGTRIRTRLNGFTLYDVDTTEVTPEQGEAFDKRAATGFLGLQRHAPGGKVAGDAYAWFRNVFVRPRS
ncbi:MAG: DUF1080 domain-containing protein [Planctomycetota bacterium]